MEDFGESSEDDISNIVVEDEGESSDEEPAAIVQPLAVSPAHIGSPSMAVHESHSEELKELGIQEDCETSEDEGRACEDELVVERAARER